MVKLSWAQGIAACLIVGLLGCDVGTDRVLVDHLKPTCEQSNYTNAIWENVISSRVKASDVAFDLYTRQGLCEIENGSVEVATRYFQTSSLLGDLYALHMSALLSHQALKPKERGVSILNMLTVANSSQDSFSHTARTAAGVAFIMQASISDIPKVVSKELRNKGISHLRISFENNDWFAECYLVALNEIENSNVDVSKCDDAKNRWREMFDLYVD